MGNSFWAPHKDDCAKPLAPRDRAEFLKALSDELALYPTVGPGLIFRISRDLQRRYFSPPSIDGTSKYR